MNSINARLDEQYNIEIRQETRETDEEAQHRREKVLKKSKLYTCLLNECFMNEQIFLNELKQVSKLDKKILVLKEDNLNVKLLGDISFLTKNVCVIELPPLWHGQSKMIDFVVQKCDELLKAVNICLSFYSQN